LRETSIKKMKKKQSHEMATRGDERLKRIGQGVGGRAVGKTGGSFLESVIKTADTG